MIITKYIHCPCEDETFLMFWLSFWANGNSFLISCKDLLARGMFKNETVDGGSHGLVFWFHLKEILQYFNMPVSFQGRGRQISTSLMSVCLVWNYSLKPCITAEQYGYNRKAHCAWLHLTPSQSKDEQRCGRTLWLTRQLAATPHGRTLYCPQCKYLYIVSVE